MLCDGALLIQLTTFEVSKIVTDEVKFIHQFKPKGRNVLRGSAVQPKFLRDEPILVLPGVLGHRRLRRQQRGARRGHQVQRNRRRAVYDADAEQEEELPRVPTPTAPGPQWHTSLNWVMKQKSFLRTFWEFILIISNR